MYSDYCCGGRNHCLRFMFCFYLVFFFFSSRRRHTRSLRDWSSDVCSSDLDRVAQHVAAAPDRLDVAVAAGRRDQLLAQLADEDVDDLELGLVDPAIEMRSEERRVGKECRSRWWR